MASRIQFLLILKLFAQGLPVVNLLDPTGYYKNRRLTKRSRIWG
jgi:hypothetical protein